jgi:hypothetical protein
MLFLDGVYRVDGADSPVFRHVAAPGAIAGADSRRAHAFQPCTSTLQF